LPAVYACAGMQRVHASFACMHYECMHAI
jgi:hypothetical protein